MHWKSYVKINFYQSPNHWARIPLRQTLIHLLPSWQDLHQTFSPLLRHIPEGDRTILFKKVGILIVFIHQFAITFYNQCNINTKFQTNMCSNFSSGFSSGKIMLQSFGSRGSLNDKTGNGSCNIQFVQCKQISIKWTFWSFWNEAKQSKLFQEWFPFHS